MSSCLALASALVSWRLEVRRQRGVKLGSCGKQHLPCLALGSALCFGQRAQFLVVCGGARRWALKPVIACAQDLPAAERALHDGITDPRIPPTRLPTHRTASVCRFACMLEMRWW